MQEDALASEYVPGLQAMQASPTAAKVPAGQVVEAKAQVDAPVTK